jgi:hypothetical protein
MEVGRLASLMETSLYKKGLLDLGWSREHLRDNILIIRYTS